MATAPPYVTAAGFAAIVSDVCGGGLAASATSGAVQAHVVIATMKGRRRISVPYPSSANLYLLDTFRLVKTGNPSAMTLRTGQRPAQRRPAPVPLRDERRTAPRGIGSLAPGAALFPLRLFLGLTFIYAGVQKLSDPGFLHPGAP